MANQFTSVSFSLRPSCLRCPVDGEKITPEGSFHDRCCEREIRDLKCSCRYEDRNCDWKGEFRNLKVGLCLNFLVGKIEVHNLFLKRMSGIFCCFAGRSKVVEFLT